MWPLLKYSVEYIQQEYYTEIFQGNIQVKYSTNNICVREILTSNRDIVLVYFYLHFFFGGKFMWDVIGAHASFSWF